MAWGEKKGEVDIWVRFSMDEAAQKRVQDGVSTVGDEIKRLTQIVADESAEKVAHENRLKRLKQEEVAATRVQSGWRRMQFTARALGEVAQITAIASSAIFVGASAWATKYVNDAKASTAVIQDWRVEVDHLKTAQTRVGAVLAETLLPLLEKAADLAESGAKFIETHPELIQAGLNVAGVIAAIATIGVAASKGFKVYADIGYTAATTKQIQAAGMYQSAATMSLEAANIDMASTTARITGVPVAAIPGVAGAGAGGAAAKVAGVSTIGVVVTTVLGILAGITGYNIIAGLTNRPSAGVIMGQGATIAGGAVVGGLGMVYAGMKALFAGDNIINAMRMGARIGVEDGFKYVGKLTGVIPKTQEETAIAYMDLFSKQNVGLYVAWQDQVTATTEEYGKRRVEIEENYESQRVQVQQDYAQQSFRTQMAFQESTSRTIRDFITSENEVEADYYERRKKAAADHSEDALRAELDHQREMRKLFEDHNDKVEGFAATRDALGYAREMRDYERKRRDAEEEYAIEQSRKNKDYAITLRDNEKQFARERAQRLAQFRQRIIDAQEDNATQAAYAAADHAATMAKMAQDHVDELAQLKTTYDDQIKMLETSFQARLRILDAAIFGDLAAVEATAAKNTAAFRAYIASAALSFGVAASAAPSRNRAGGGYVGYGQYWLGENGSEFVLSNISTRLAETSLGGNLTQEKLIAALMGSGRGGGYNDQRTMQFNGMTAADRDWTRSLVAKISEQTIIDAVRVRR